MVSIVPPEVNTASTRDRYACLLYHTKHGLTADSLRVVREIEKHYANTLDPEATGGTMVGTQFRRPLHTDLMMEFTPDLGADGDYTKDLALALGLGIIETGVRENRRTLYFEDESGRVWLGRNRLDSHRLLRTHDQARTRMNVRVQTVLEENLESAVSTLVEAFNEMPHDVSAEPVDKALRRSLEAALADLG